MNTNASVDRPWSDELIYQIVPDRFRMGAGPSPQDHIRNGRLPENAFLQPWDAPCTEGALYGQEYYGGNLRGVIESLPYLQELGITSIYSTPVTPSPSYIKYDTTNYFEIDPALGTMQDFEELLDGLHTRGMRFIMDMVLNHCSSRHPWFMEAQQDPVSPRRNWFSFTPDNRWKCWRSHAGLPEFNYDNPETLQAMITGENTPLAFWAKKGVDAFRLDCANDLGLDRCRLLLEKLRSIQPGAALFGEVWNYAAGWLNAMDGAQSYFITDSILSLLTGTITAKQFGMNITTLARNAPHDALLRSWSMLCSHDYRRLANSLGEPASRHDMAALLQFTLPGIPVIYYGEEIALAGPQNGNDPFNRGPMNWNNPGDHPRQAFLRKLANLRNSREELRRGTFRDLSAWLDNGVVAFLRSSPERPRQFGLTLANPADETSTFRLFLPCSHLHDQMNLRDELSGKTFRFTNYLDISLPPGAFHYLTPDPDYIPRYTFYKT